MAVVEGKLITLFGGGLGSDSYSDTVDAYHYIEGLDVVNVGLGAVLYDTKTHKYYTPNTDTSADLSQTQSNIQHLIEDKEIDTAFEQSGNSSDG